jgi:hypothetical protein
MKPHSLVGKGCLYTLASNGVRIPKRRMLPKRPFYYVLCDKTKDNGFDSSHQWFYNT